jgi:SpoVK/Ycf46/Vps4 family AAA+-type ATPase
VQHLGGYPALRQILEEAAATFSPAARAFGVTPHKGLLLVGLPGVGKDLTKRIASSVLGRPLLDLDFGTLMGAGGGVLGSAERAIREALGRAELVRGILGLSEYEKATAGLGSSDRTDGGTTARMLATLLNWMQEQQHVFVVATANDVRQLPPEQLRQGRFGQVLFMDVPRAADRQSIFAVHLARIKRDPAAYDLVALAQATEGFSGAEIEGVVKAALTDAFRDGARELTTADMLARAETITPISVLKREEVEALRAWAREHGALDVAALGAAPAMPSQSRTAGLEL